MGNSSEYVVHNPGRLWNFLILILSGAALFGVMFPLLFKPDDDIVSTLKFFDLFACLFFIVDVLWRWIAGGRKIGFWKWGWVDFVSSIPYLYWLRLGRIFSILRTVRDSPRARQLTHIFVRSRTGLMLIFSAIAFFCSIWIFGIIILHFERSAENPLIKTAFDSVWFAVETVTTVGYGDIYPVTWQGRVAAICLMLVGITLFSLNSGLWASWILREFHIKLRSPKKYSKEDFKVAKKSPHKNLRTSKDIKNNIKNN